MPPARSAMLCAVTVFDTSPSLVSRISTLSSGATTAVGRSSEGAVGVLSSPAFSVTIRSTGSEDIPLFLNTTRNGSLAVEYTAVSTAVIFHVKSVVFVVIVPTML